MWLHKLWLTVRNSLWLVPVLFDAYDSYDHGPPDGAHARGVAELLALFPAHAGRPL